LDNVDIFWIPADILGTPVDVFNASFLDGAQNGFGPRTSPPLLAPVLDATANGLRASGVGSAATDTVFGSWVNESPLLFAPNRIYRLDFTVGSTVPEAEKAQVPGFRMRVNDS